MEINSINGFSTGKTVKGFKPAFGAVHPARYFVKNVDNTYTQVTDSESIKLLQRTVVSYLNKFANDRIQTLQGKTPKKETAAAGVLRERLMRFFISNDRDYAHRRVVCSFYDTRNNETVPYIFTGNSTDDVTALAKPIGQLKSALHSKIKSICKQYNLPSTEARRYLTKEEDALYKAQSNYYRTLYRTVNEEVKSGKPVNSYFYAYFEPIKTKKKTNYTLVNAKFVNRMI